VFRAFPTNPPKTEPPTWGRESAGFREWTLFSEPGIRVRGLVRSPSVRGSSRLPTVVYIASDGEDEGSIRRTLGQVLNDEKLLLIVFPRGVDEVPWRRTVQRDVLRNAMHVGRSLDFMRLWDVMRSVDALKQQPDADPQRITVLGRGISGVLGLYAAIFDESIAQVVLLEPPASSPARAHLLEHSSVYRSSGSCSFAGPPAPDLLWQNSRSLSTDSDGVSVNGQTRKYFADDEPEGSARSTV
jgi:hypothetical protein